MFAKINVSSVAQTIREALHQYGGAWLGWVWLLQGIFQGSQGMSHCKKGNSVVNSATPPTQEREGVFWQGAATPLN